MKTLIIHFACPDQSGIVAKITNLLFDAGGNILALEQHVETSELFFMRIKVDLPGNKHDNTLKSLESLASQLSAKVSWRHPDTPAEVAIMVSKEPHCLIDLLARQEAGELDCQIAMIISNHNALGTPAKRYNIPFHYLPINGEETQEQEKQVLQLLNSNHIDLVVLARYMKILSPEFVSQFEERIINIHHSFLPAFKGAKPYHRAWERGVKVIGATAHYATPELDEGPIIAQDIKRVSHHHSIDSLIEAGREIEQRVLASAVKAWLDYRIIVQGHRTIIFHP